MSYQLFLGYIYEGITDKKFFNSVIERSITDILFQYSTKDVEIVLIPFETLGNSFVKQSLHAIETGRKENSIDIFFIHSDADDVTNETVMKYKFQPLLKAIADDNNIVECSIIPIIPVQMTETWLLADFELFANEVSTVKTKSQLNLSGNPEEFTNPKLKIIESLRIINNERPKKRRKDLVISELYQILGQKLEINNLKKLKSFQDFYNQSFDVLKKIKLINDNITINP